MRVLSNRINTIIFALLLCTHLAYADTQSTGLSDTGLVHHSDLIIIGTVMDIREMGTGDNTSETFSSHNLIQIQIGRVLKGTDRLSARLPNYTFLPDSHLYLAEHIANTETPLTKFVIGEEIVTCLTKTTKFGTAGSIYKGMEYLTPYIHYIDEDLLYRPTDNQHKKISPESETTVKKLCENYTNKAEGATEESIENELKLIDTGIPYYEVLNKLGNPMMKNRVGDLDCYIFNRRAKGMFGSVGKNCWIVIGFKDNMVHDKRRVYIDK